MAVFKCKMCGGDLEIIAGSSVCTCEYCGTKQTVPSADNEKKMTLFTRANRLLRGCEFDRAAGLYETIAAEFPEEAEAYWGLVLCKYGIEYVDDPATGKRVPTCRRSSFDSVTEDANYAQALRCADTVAREVYRAEAETLETLRKDIIAVSSKEEPYDIFICYKETDDKGERTLDSVLAQDTYDALTEKGYKVFFSRITLEDKLGQEYEPYIFAALNSAKVMLAFGTDPEYYEAVWVKNEWSRFLQLIAKGEKKTLIPCYKNIDPYDLPKEFARLQAQDMGKVGAMQDLLRGVEKILPRKTAAAEKAEAAPEAPAVKMQPVNKKKLALIGAGALAAVILMVAVLGGGKSSPGGGTASTPYQSVEEIGTFSNSQSKVYSNTTQLNMDERDSEMTDEDFAMMEKLECVTTLSYTPSPDIEDFSRLARIPENVRQTVEVLHINRSNITEYYLESFDGLELFPNAKELVLWGGYGEAYADLSTFGKLTKLEHLEIQGNYNSSMTDISGLAGLTELQYLELDYTELSSLRGLENMTKLTYLNLGDSGSSDNDATFTDTDALKNLTALETLHLPETASPCDLGGLSGMKSLKALDLGCGVDNLSPLSGLPLEKMWISETSDLSGLAGITTLKGLKIVQYNPEGKADVSAIGTLTGLQALSLSCYGNSANSVYMLLNIYGADATLEKLYEEAPYYGCSREDIDQAIVDISSWANLTDLRELEVSGLLIADRSPLDNCKKLAKSGSSYDYYID